MLSRKPAGMKIQKGRICRGHIFLGNCAIDPGPGAVAFSVDVEIRCSLFQGAPEPVTEFVVARSAAFGTGTYRCVMAILVERGGSASAEVRVP